MRIEVESIRLGKEYAETNGESPLGLLFISISDPVGTGKALKIGWIAVALADRTPNEGTYCVVAATGWTSRSPSYEKKKKL
jgi:hypothetical protein